MITKYNEILETQPLFLKKSEYSSKDLPLDTQIQKSETYIGETEHPVGNIKFLLKDNTNSDDEIFITITDIKQDLSILSE